MVSGAAISVVLGGQILAKNAVDTLVPPGSREAARFPTNLNRRCLV